MGTATTKPRRLTGNDAAAAATAPPPSPASSPATSEVSSLLPLGDVNVVVVTDVHSWLAGHRRHDPHLNADYGDVVSFHSVLYDALESEGRDLFFVNNGDFMDGTGLSRNRPVELTDLLSRVPFDAVNVGNHDIDEDERTRYIMEKGGFVDGWGGRYLTTNVADASDVPFPMGTRYRFLGGPNSGVTVLTFGFLYNLGDEASRHVIVERVEEVVEYDWFKSVLSGDEGHYDAILVLAHMDAVDPLVSVILNAIRERAGDEVPVQFITGHTHRRGTDRPDSNSASFEAGRYLDTVGFVSFPAVDTVRAARNGTEGKGGEGDGSPSDLFKHVFLDANVKVLSDALGLDSPEDMKTDMGMAFSKRINSVRERMHLTQTIGCASHSYHLDAPLSDPDSLWGLYLDEVLPYALFQQNASRAFVQNIPWTFRDDLREGNVTLDDLYAASPFDNDVLIIAEGIPGEVLLALDASLNGHSEERAWGHLPEYGFAGEIREGARYDLYSESFVVESIVNALEGVLGRKVSDPRPLIRDGRTVSLIPLWESFVSENWACFPEGSVRPGLGGSSGFLAGMHVSVLDLYVGTLVLTVVIGAVYHFCSKSRRRKAREFRPVENNDIAQRNGEML